MSETVKITIDGKEIVAEKGSYILAAAIKNGIYIPTLCNVEGIKPRGSCRICTVKVNGRMMTACSTPVADGMKVENDTEEIRRIRKQIIELLFVEGNHYCPACEKSGNCELQALGYRYGMLVPRFTYEFPNRDVDASNPKIIKDHNRCILCNRCIRLIKDEKGRSMFVPRKRGHKMTVEIDNELAMTISDELAQKAAEICPVGSILKKEKGFNMPIDSRKFDKKPIGYDIEQGKEAASSKEN